MLWIFRRFLDRLFVKSAAQVASEFETQINLQMVEMQATLLRRAHDLEQEGISGFDDIAAGLRAQAARMGGRGDIPAADVLAVVAVLRQENLRDGDGDDACLPGQRTGSVQNAVSAIAGPAMKKRGRPRKDVSVQVNDECGN